MAYFYGPASSQKLLQIIFFLTFPVRIPDPANGRPDFPPLQHPCGQSRWTVWHVPALHRCPVNALFNSNNTSTIPCFWYLKQMFCAIIFEIIAHFLLHFIFDG